MKHRISVWVVSLLCLAGTHGFAQDTEEELDPRTSWEVTEANWAEFNHFDSGFSIISPGIFSEKTDTLKTAIGQQIYRTFFFTPQHDRAENEIYMVGYTEYPEGAIPADSTDLIQALFDETEDVAVETVRGELLFSQNGFLQDFPYRYWRIDYLNGRASIRTKAVFANGRFYTVQTVTRREHGINYSTDRFIDSFRIFAQEEE